MAHAAPPTATLDIKNVQLKLLNMICSTMITEPRYYMSADVRASQLAELVATVASYGDPEFVLKLALYVREDLNIRSTANYLLALAANTVPCHAFFKKYFGNIIKLPSDLLEVVGFYSLLPNCYLADNSLPGCLRKAIIKRFAEFDNYQLAKYNKERAIKRKAKKAKDHGDATPALLAKGKGKGKAAPSAAAVTDVDKPKITLKQLIRKVHIAQPAEAVMALLGKKYPSTAEKFAKSGLSGTWDSTKVGKRMKLPIPETWETELSAKGNKHTTWQELLDNKKLPFMAMLRNLRNMIITGVSPSHHEQIIGRLTDEKSVANSKQLPWRFLSAYQAIDVNLEQMMNDILDNDGSEEKVVKVHVRGKKGMQMDNSRQIKKKVIIPVYMPDMPLISRYREAIDTAIRLSVVNNLAPISGKSVVFCDVSGSMKCPCSTAKLPSLQQVYEVAILLGLMLQDVCEECDFRIFSSPSSSSNGKCHLGIKLIPNTILANVKRVTDEAATLGGGTDFPFDYLEGLIKNKTHLDQFIILSDMMIAPAFNEMNEGHNKHKSVSDILKRYRQEVNPNLLFVAVDLYGSGKSLVDVATSESHPNDILITGFSDHILRFIAERGNAKQLEYVQAIDSKLKDRKKNKDKAGSSSSTAIVDNGMDTAQ